MDIWDEFFQLEDNPGRDSFFKSLRRISVGELEANDYLAQRLTWFIMKAVSMYMDGKWPPNPSCFPFSNWKDPEVIKAREEAVEGMICNMADKMGVR